MTVWLKQSTAVTVKVGPFLDSADGNTVENALTIQKADVRLAKNGGNMAAASADQGASDAGAPYDEIGYYDISLDATDTATLGSLRVMIHKAGALAVWQDFMVVPANVWDSMFGADKLQVDASELLTLEIAEDYSALGDPVTLAQAVYELLARDQELSRAAGVITLRKRDGSTTALQITADNPTAPLTVTRTA